MSSDANAYGAAKGSGDTSFRRTWDREEWAAKAKERESVEKVESKLRYEAKLQGKKHHSTPATDDVTMTSARRSRINFAENLNKVQLVASGSGVGKRGKSAGFYCETCDLTFKDSLQWVDHLNSKQHLSATGQTGEVARAGLQEVLERLEWLKEKKREQEKGAEWDLKARLEEHAKEEEEKRRLKREKRKELRKRKRVGEIKVEEKEERERAAGEDGGGHDEEMEDADAIAMARMMGFSGAFGSTKKTS